MWIIWVCLAELLILFFLSRVLTQTLGKWLMQVSHSQKTTVRVMALLFFPGVVIHELAHFFTAIVLFVRVGDISLWPRIQDNNLKLGSVQVGKTDPVRNALIGLAPILFGTAIMIGSMYFAFRQQNFFSLQWWEMIALFYIVFVVGNTMFSSKRDVEGILPLIIFLIILGITLFFAGFRFTIIFPKAVLDFFSQTAIFLLLPIAINILTITVLRFIQNK